jgi:hypothetical protein
MSVACFGLIRFRPGHVNEIQEAPVVAYDFFDIGSHNLKRATAVMKKGKMGVLTAPLGAGNCVREHRQDLIILDAAKEYTDDAMDAIESVHLISPTSLLAGSVLIEPFFRQPNDILSKSMRVVQEDLWRDMTDEYKMTALKVRALLQNDPDSYKPTGGIGE